MLKTGLTSNSYNITYSNEFCAGDFGHGLLQSVCFTTDVTLHVSLFVCCCLTI